MPKCQELFVAPFLQQWIIAPLAFEDKQCCIIWLVGTRSRSDDWALNVSVITIPGYYGCLANQQMLFECNMIISYKFSGRVALYLSIFWANICKVAMGLVQFYSVLYFINLYQRWTKLLKHRCLIWFFKNDNKKLKFKIKIIFSILFSTLERKTIGLTEQI